MKRFLQFLGVVVAVVVMRLVMSRGLAFGVVTFDRQRLEQARDTGVKVDTTVVGVAQFASDVTPELAAAAMAHLRVIGVLDAPHPIQQALAGRVTVTGTVA